MKCFKCGAKLPPESKFCPKCGEAQGFSAELMDRAKNGDQDALAELYNRTYNNVYLTVKTLIKSEDTILDIVQDSYVKGFQSLSQLQDPDKFRAWIKRIGYNKAVDYLRKAKPVAFSTMSTEDEAIEFEDDRTENLPDIVIDQKETTRLIKDILDSLSEDQRLVVGMFYYEQMSVKEIAETLGVSENTVKSRLAYARKKIEVQVKELEKKGTKLYSLAPLPFLLLLFKSMDAQAAELPNPNILQAVQEECSSVPSAGAEPANTASAANSAVESAVKTAAGTASKGIAAKVIAGITAAVVIGGGAFGIAAWNNNKEEPEKKPQSSVQEESQQAPQEEIQEEIKLSPEEIYQPILDEYSLAMTADPNNVSHEFPNVNQVMMNYYYQYGGYDGVYFIGFYYDFYDIDGNGTEELLIGNGSKFKDVVDVYAVKDNQPQKLIDDPSLGDRSQLHIYPDGTMLLYGSSGAVDNSMTTYRLGADGVSLSEETELIEGVYDLEVLFAEKSNNQEEVDSFDWKPIDPKWETEKAGDPKEYIDRYMNGQDWNAGCLTIEENDAESVKVRLEAFKNRSDQELSIIFEGVGYAVQDGLIVDVSGKQVKLTKGNIGLILDVPPSLRLEWSLDPHIYSEEYLSTTPMEPSGTAQEGTVDLTQYDGYLCYQDGSPLFRLDTADGNLTLIHISLFGPEQVVSETPYFMNLDTANISDHTYSINDITDSVGQNRNFNFYSLQFTFEEDRVIMNVESNHASFPGGANDIIYSGTYEFTLN